MSGSLRPISSFLHFFSCLDWQHVVWCKVHMSHTSEKLSELFDHQKCLSEVRLLCDTTRRRWKINSKPPRSRRMTLEANQAATEKTEKSLVGVKQMPAPWLINAEKSLKGSFSFTFVCRLRQSNTQTFKTKPTISLTFASRLASSCLSCGSVLHAGCLPVSEHVCVFKCCVWTCMCI